MSANKPNDKCPCCDREFKYFGHYPLMQVVSVSFLKPEEVPKVIPGPRTDESLVEKPKKRIFGGAGKEILVPADVVAYFTENPKEAYCAHSDGYVYTRFAFRYSEKSKEEVRWERTLNLSNSIREMVANNATLRKYLAPLEDMVGKTVSTKDFADQFIGEKHIGDEVYLLLGEGGPEEGFRTVRFSLNTNPREMGRLHREVMYTPLLDNLAKVKYVGKMLR